MRRLLLIVGVCPLFVGLSAAAKPTIVVGTCKAGNQTATIQEAVDIVGAGGIVDVCPGRYPEQVTITKSLTLLGISTSNSPNTHAAIVTAPSAGVVANTTDVDGGQPIAAQLLVQNTGGVTISNLTVDGRNNQLSGCSTILAGILFQNASGTVSGNAVVNQSLPGGLNGCQDGLAVFVETAASSSTPSAVTISKNYVAGYDKNGITAVDAGTNAKIQSNTVAGVSATASSAQNGIQLGPNATGSIVGNVVSDDYYTLTSSNGYFATGILVYDAAGTPVTGNTVGDTQEAVSIYADTAGASDGANVSTNIIRATHNYDGIDICGAGNATIKTNTIIGSDESAIHLDSECGAASTGNTVSGNTINYACAGILEGPGSGGTVGTNTFINTVTDVLTGSDVCPVATGSAFHKPHNAARRPLPMR